MNGKCFFAATIAAAGLLAATMPAHAATMLKVHAVGVANGTDGSGILGLVGAEYIDSPFILDATLDLTKGTRDITAHQDYVYGYDIDGPGLATLTTGGNVAAWGTAFSAIGAFFGGSLSEVQVIFQNELGSKNTTVDVVREDLLFSSLDSLPATNLCIGARNCHVSIHQPGQTNVFVNLDSLTISSPAVPEPASWALLILGFGAIGTALRRRQSVAA